MPTYDLPGVYIEEIKPTGAPVKPVGTGVIGLVGKFPQGPVNTPVRCGSWEQFVENFGGLVVGSAAYEAYFAFRQNAPAIYVVRVQGNRAEATIKDTDSQDRAKFKALVDGEQGNAIQITVEDGTITGTNKITIKYGYADRGETTAPGRSHSHSHSPSPSPPSPAVRPLIHALVLAEIPITS